MQTFLPYSNFPKSAQVLDNKRLGKQRVEAKQILQINLFIKNKIDAFICENCLNLAYGSVDSHICKHPYNTADGFTEITYKTYKEIYGKIPWENSAIRMWRGYETCLAFYGFIICKEWVARGFNDSLLDFFKTTAVELNPGTFIGAYFEDGFLPMEFLPPWLGNKRFHNSHRDNLLRKDFEYYSEKFLSGEFAKKYLSETKSYENTKYEWNEKYWR